MKLISSISFALWGNLTREEYGKFGLLSIILSFIVGSYWLLRPLKDALFAGFVGASYLPYAKIASVIFLIPLILLYSKMVDIFEKQQLIYIITSIYGGLFFCAAYLLANPTAEIANTILCKYQILGWAIFLGVESFISLVFSLFWSFVASTTDTVSAKRGYALIFAGAQIGTIIGPEFAKHATQIGIPMLIFIAACGIFMIPLMTMLFIKLHPHVITVKSRDKKTSTGFIEGLRLLFTRPYLIGILGVAILGNIISTILEFELIYFAQKSYNSVENITEFLGLYGQSINFSTLIFALFGTSLVIRKLGLTLSLVAYPIIVGIIVCAVWYYPTLWVLFTAMVVIKCLSYALNSPCKEIMYIPTSNDVKFKAKSWIDTIGYRLSGSVGGGVGVAFPGIASLIYFGSIISLVVTVIWIIAAICVGIKNQQLVKNDEIIK